MLKYNVKTTFMHNKVDIGMRDYEGNFINAKTTSFPSSLQVKEGEAFDLLQGAFDLLQGIKWIGELSLNNVSDFNMSVIQPYVWIYFFLVSTLEIIFTIFQMSCVI